VTLLKAREHVENPWGVVFASQLSKLRDRSNTNADIREALDLLGFGWVTSHTFRKTAATLLNDGGLTVREVADQFGHKRVSITQDTYFGRAAASPKWRSCWRSSMRLVHKVWERCGGDLAIATPHLLDQPLCAPEGIRTPNLLIRSQMLYPLSYGRMFSCRPAGAGRCGGSGI
jgi:hypothetical protein